MRVACGCMMVSGGGSANLELILPDEQQKHHVFVFAKGCSTSSLGRRCCDCTLISSPGYALWCWTWTDAVCYCGSGRRAQVRQRLLVSSPAGPGDSGWWAKAKETVFCSVGISSLGDATFTTFLLR